MTDLSALIAREREASENLLDAERERRAAREALDAVDTALRRVEKLSWRDLDTRSAAIADLQAAEKRLARHLEHAAEEFTHLAEKAGAAYDAVKAARHPDDI